MQVHTDFISEREKLNQELKEHVPQIALNREGNESTVESGANPGESADRVRNCLCHRGPM